MLCVMMANIAALELRFFSPVRVLLWFIYVAEVPSILTYFSFHSILVLSVVVLRSRMPVPPLPPQIDIIWVMEIVWRVRGKIIRSVLCNIVCNNCAECNAHIWTYLTVLWIAFCLTGPISFLCMYVFSVWLYIACMCSTVTWWAGRGGIEAYPEDYYFLQCFDTVGWVIWPVKTRPRYDL